MHKQDRKSAYTKNITERNSRLNIDNTQTVNETSMPSICGWGPLVKFTSNCNPQLDCLAYKTMPVGRDSVQVKNLALETQKHPFHAQNKILKHWHIPSMIKIESQDTDTSLPCSKKNLNTQKRPYHAQQRISRHWHIQWVSHLGFYVLHNRKH